jgi:repressor LexA
MTKELTDKQQIILNYIREKINESGFPPTVREIGDRFGITVKGAYDHLKAIEKKGHIKTEQNKSRAIVVLNEEGTVQPHPVYLSP